MKRTRKARSHNFRLVRFTSSIQLINGGVSRSLCSTAWSDLEKDHLLSPSEDDYMYPKHRCIAMQCATSWNRDTQISIRNKHQSWQQFVHAKRRIWNNMWICLFESLCWALQNQSEFNINRISSSGICLVALNINNTNKQTNKQACLQ
jgi:hypothetical protein